MSVGSVVIRRDLLKQLDGKGYFKDEGSAAKSKNPHMKSR